MNITLAQNMPMHKAILPVIVERISNSLTDEIAVLLQRVLCVLHNLLDGLVYGLTHLFDLIDTLTRLWKRAGRKKTLTKHNKNMNISRLHFSPFHLPALVEFNLFFFFLALNLTSWTFIEQTN